MRRSKILTVLFLIFLAASCEEKKPFKKPFLIFDKNVNCDVDSRCLYQYQDANGRTFIFYDTNEKYNVGDTIK